MHHNIEKVYPYVMGWWKILLLVVLGAVLGIFASQTALNNEVGLIINGIVELGVEGATVFWWCVAGILWMMVPFGMIGIIDKLKGENRIAITAEGVVLPNPVWKKGEAYFTFRSVQELTARTMQKVRLLTVRTTEKSYTIVSNRLPRADDFDEIARTIAERSNIN